MGRLMRTPCLFRELIMNKEISEALQEAVFTVTGRRLDLTGDIDLLKDGSIDIFGLCEIVVALEERFGFDIPDSDVSRFSSPALAAEYIGERLAEIRRWVQEGNA